jgi:hypothetical protein
LAAIAMPLWRSESGMESRYIKNDKMKTLPLPL